MVCVRDPGFDPFDPIRCAGRRRRGRYSEATKPLPTREGPRLFFLSSPLSALPNPEPSLPEKRASRRSPVTEKEEVRRILDELPDDATLEDIQYRIYVRQQIEQGLADAQAGRVLTQAEAEQRMSRWLRK